MTEDVVTGDGGTLQNVVVYLKGDFTQYSFDAPTTPATIDQKGCQYFPHVLALMTDQPLSVVNSDMTTHNIHPVPKNNREWNESQPPGSAPIMQSFAREEVAIPVKCNVHPVDEGIYRRNRHALLPGHRQGRLLRNQERSAGHLHGLRWHETYGTQDQMVTVGPPKNRRLMLTFKTAAASD